MSDTTQVLGIPASWVLALGFFLFPLGIFLLLQSEAYRRGNFVQKLTLWLFGCIQISMTIGVFIVLSAKGAKSVEQLFPAGSPPFLLTWTGIIGAGVLFLMRQRSRATYGAIEIAVGILTLAVTSKNMTMDTVIATTIGFVGGIYVMVRGMVNIEEARQTKNKDPSPP